MKKLMITLAAAGLVGSVWAGCGDSDDCLVYDLKVTLKTLGPKAQKCKATCADATVYYLDTVTRALKGYAWSCDYDCDCNDGTKTALKLALWEPKAELGWWLYDTNAKTADQNIADLTANTIRFAKKGSKAAVWFDVVDAAGTDWNAQCQNSRYKVESTLRFVGFGTAAKNKNLNSCIVKSVSGNVIGDVTPDVRCAKTKKTPGNWCDDDVTECCNDYDIRWACLCNCDVDWCDAVDHLKIMDDADLPNGRVPAYGTWSMKYNASLSSSKSKVKLTDKLPKYATK